MKLRTLVALFFVLLLFSVLSLKLALDSGKVSTCIEEVKPR